MYDVTVAFCTKDRPEPLLRAVEALGADLASCPLRAQVLVIDDGGLDDGLTRSLRETVGPHAFRHERKPAVTHGLYESRRIAVEMAEAPFILFLDDDAEVEGGYVAKVIARFRADPGLTGVGGVDGRSLPLGLGRIGRAYARLFGMSSGSVGRLSRTGLNYSQAEWRLMTGDFETEYLHGCNMAFRVDALRGLGPVPWLLGHSPCEDLHLSRVAATRGRLVIDTSLLVTHHSVPGGRGEGRERIRRRLAAMREFSKAHGRSSPLGFAWSVLGMCLKDMGCCLPSLSRGASGDLVEAASGYALFAVTCWSSTRD